MTKVHTPGATYKMPAVTFKGWWEVPMSYTYILDTTQLAPIWFELDASIRDDFRPTSEDLYKATEHQLGLDLPGITHRVVSMAKEVNFTTHY